MNFNEFLHIPIGPDHPIKEKIKWANFLYKRYAKMLLEDSELVFLLKDYEQAIKESWQIMTETGVVSECTRCATVDGGSCCGSGIENKFDVVNLLINLLFGKKIPEQPFDPTGCWFLGERGCLLLARHVICVNFMCKRLHHVLSDNDLKKVQRCMEKETEAAFMVEEYIKSLLSKIG